MDPSYNNSFGGQSGQTARPVISSGGDVMLPVSKNNSKKKWLIVAGVVLLLVAGGLGVLAWAMNRPNTEVVVVEYEKKFNNFANYIIDGTINSEKLVGTYELDEIYKIDDVMIDGNNEEQQEYFQVAEDLWKQFDDEYAKIDASKNSNYVINSYIEALDKKIDFIVDYVNADENMKKEVVREYKGLSATERLTSAMEEKTIDDSCSSVSKYVFLISDLIEEPDKMVLNEEGEDEESE